jgi:hypothetical protein
MLGRQGLNGTAVSGGPTQVMKMSLNTSRAAMTRLSEALLFAD